jgi:Domain of unknown function (DUF4395)
MNREDLKKRGFFIYGKVIPGLMVHGKPAPYPVLNERAIRAGAGIVFAVGFFSFFQALYLGNFFFLKLLVPFLFFDFLMKVVVGIRFSPMSQLVRAQQPEWVGAVQKRFAWSIGLVLSGTMMLLLYVFEVRGWPNLTICSICLTFMFMESAFGICVGCKIYNWLMKKGIIETPEYKPACPGNVCSI